jgi:hypothetical protein
MKTKTAFVMGALLAGCVGIVSCGGDDSATAPLDASAGHAGTGGGTGGHAGSGTGGNNIGTGGTKADAGGSSGSAEAGEAGGAAGTSEAGEAGGAAGTSDAGGAAGNSDSGGTVDADANSATDATDAVTTTDTGSDAVTDGSGTKDAEGGVDAIADSPADNGQDSTSSDAGDGSTCPAAMPANDTSCGNFMTCAYSDGQVSCVCHFGGAVTDAGRHWTCNGGVNMDAGTGGCPGTQPPNNGTCTTQGLFCQYGGTNCFCFNNGSGDHWVCF